MTQTVIQTKEQTKLELLLHHHAHLDTLILNVIIISTIALLIIIITESDHVDSFPITAQLERLFCL